MLFTLQASCRTEAPGTDTFPRGQNPGKLIVLFQSSLGGVGHTVARGPSWWGEQVTHLMSTSFLAIMFTSAY